MANSWKDLVVWQKAYEMVLEIYRLIKSFPKTETYALVDQIKRAAYSIPANIVEGHSKNTKNDIYNDLESKLTEISYLLNQLIKSLTSKPLQLLQPLQHLEPLQPLKLLYPQIKRFHVN